MMVIKILKKIYHKCRLAKIRKDISKKVTLKGEKYEFTGKCRISTLRGATKANIILNNDVTILGCNIICTHEGKVLLHEHSKLQNTNIFCVDSIEIGEYTAIANNVTITDNNNHPVNPDFRKFMRTTPHGSDARSWIHSDHAPVKIGENCWIGQNVRIQKGVIIGDNSIIAANSVVTKSVPANCIAAGNPAKVVKTDIHLIPAPTTCNEYNEYLKNGNRF